MILEYILKYRLEDCLKILSEKDNLAYYSIKIDFLEFNENYPDVADNVLWSPIDSLPSCNTDIIKAQQYLMEQVKYKDFVSKLDYCYLKRNVHARFFHLPVNPEVHRIIFPKNVDYGCFLNVTGTVVRVTQSKMLEYQRKYVCVKCRYENTVEAKFEKRYILKAPSRCANDEAKCKSTTFTQVTLVSREHCKDYQEIKIQEQVNKLSIGTMPGSMWVVLENDLVDCCKPGDDVIICGTVRRRWRPLVVNKKSEVELVFEANSLEVCNAQSSQVIAASPDVKECFDQFWEKYEACPLKGRDRILENVCTQVYGLHLVKLAVLLTVITGLDHALDDEDTGSSAEDKHTNHVRGQCHLLLVGDPGTGKSQLLRAAAELSTRSVFTSGACSTRAGLTCAALREEGVWQLEAGALVLSDGGVCCIDEIGQLRDHDRTAIHEAMEQQTISIAKAIVCKLNTRCAVIAACNPKGHYQSSEPLSANVSLGTPLLSRFDLIFILLDKKDRQWDRQVSSFILFGGSLAAEPNKESKKQWSLEKLQMYIGLVGPRPTEMTKSANVILKSYYMMQRNAQHRDPSRTTVRMLDSLIRLSQAHCRLMYRTTILPMDAIVAVALVDLSMQDCTLSDTVDALHSTFQKHPDFEYLCTAKELLTKLSLYEIWQQELLYYGKLLQVDHRTLESEIDKRSAHYFAKFDDVTDDSIPLPSSLITSSYFKDNKNSENKCDTDDIASKDYQKVNIEVNKVNKKLTDIIKKQPTLNKEKQPDIQKKIPSKRKRKEVTVDTSKICKKPEKIKRKANSLKANKANGISDSEEENDPTKLLNAVPSVNDFFADLDIDLKFDNSATNDEGFVNRHSTQKHSVTDNKVDTCEKESEIIVNMYEESRKNTSISDLNTSKSSTKHKLKKYQCTTKHDLSKYEPAMERSKSVSETVAVENTTVPLPQPNTVVPLQNVKNNPRSSQANVSKESKHSMPSSQLSMFESSDLDMDFDLDL